MPCRVAVDTTARGTSGKERDGPVLRSGKLGGRGFRKEPGQEPKSSVDSLAPTSRNG